jgi:hypothetical protein
MPGGHAAEATLGGRSLAFHDRPPKVNAARHCHGMVRAFVPLREIFRPRGTGSPGTRGMLQDQRLGNGPGLGRALL